MLKPSQKTTEWNFIALMFEIQVDFTQYETDTFVLLLPKMEQGTLIDWNENNLFLSRKPRISWNISH